MGQGTWVRDPSIAALRGACQFQPGGIGAFAGRFYLKIETSEHSMQFPATMRFSAAQLSIEVSNILGGEVFRANGTSDRISIQSQAYPELNASNVQNWQGIPVAWITQLLRGNTICPDESEWLKAVRDDTDGSWLIATRGANWSIHLMQFGTQPRVQSLTYIPKNSTDSIALSVEDFDDLGRIRRAKVIHQSFSMGWSWKLREN